MKKYIAAGAVVFLLFSVSIVFHPEDREIPKEMQGETAAERMDGEETERFIREGSFYRDENGNFVFRLKKDPAFDGTAEAAGGRSDVFVLSPLDEPTENALKQTVETLRAGGENKSFDWENANVLRAHLKLDYALCGSAKTTKSARKWERDTEQALELAKTLTLLSLLFPKKQEQSLLQIPA